MNKHQVLKILRKACGDNIAKWANANGIKPPHLHDILHERRGLGKKILKALGIEKIVSYRRVK